MKLKMEVAKNLFSRSAGVRAVMLLAIAVGLSGCSGLKDNPYAHQSSLLQSYPEGPAPVESTSQQQADALEGQSRALFAQGQNTQGLMVLKQAADLGSGSASYQMARHYIQGRIVREDDKLAHDYLVRSDAAGYAEGTRVLAWQTLRGSGTTQNIALAKQLFDKASQRSVRAQRESGLLYLGKLQPSLNDPVKGASLLRSAYQAGDAESAYYYSKAIRVASESEARNALLFAGKAGFPEALMEVGDYALQQGDSKYASACYMKASLAGNTRAMMSYANNVLIGRFPSQNRELVAYTWYSIANDYKQPQAREELQALDGVRRIYDRSNPGYLSKLKTETIRMINPWNQDT
jgi:TPR repeat protein